jgi:PAS domain S-box-containing protein
MTRPIDVSELETLLHERERELRACEERFRATFDQAAVGMAHIDPHGGWLRINRRLCAIAGCTEEELRGRTLLDLTHPGDRLAGEHLLRSLREGKDAGEPLEVRLVRKDGSTIWVRLTVSLAGARDADDRYLVAVMEDITPGRDAEEALRDSESLFRTIFDQAFQLMGLMRPDGTLISINRTAADLIRAEKPEPSGLPFPFRALEPFFASPGGNEVIGKPFWDTPWWDHSPELQERLRDAVARSNRGEVVRFEATHLTPEGKTVWVDFSLTPIRDGEGNVVLLVPEGRDITARKMAEDALRESEEKFSKAFLAVPNLLVIVTLPYEKYVEVNEAFERTFGYHQNEVFGRTLTEIDIWENPTDRAEVIRTIRDTGRIRDRELGFRDRDGRVFTGLLSAEVIELCGVTCMVCIITDITARKEAEEALRRSEEKFAKAFLHMPSLLVVSSTLREGRLVDVNEAFEKAFKCKREEVIGRSALDLNLWVDPEDRDRVIQDLHERKEVRDREIRFRDLTGRVFVGLYSATIIDINGEECLLSIMNDVTERKEMVGEIEKLNTDLSSRAFELETANRELEAFTYTVSHDLRRPLTIINGYCQVILDMCAENLGEQCRGYLQEIYEGTLDMGELIETLLKFSRLMHGELHRQTIDLGAMATDVAAGLRLAEPERRVDLRITEEVTAEGDEGLVRVVLENLLGNAWKYTAKREEAVIEFGVAETAEARAFFVRDNGIGFDPAWTERLFLPFQRLPGIDEFKGHGIGLATVERIVRRHGGRVWAEGEPGMGATFWFTLPGGR